MSTRGLKLARGMALFFTTLLAVACGGEAGEQGSPGETSISDSQGDASGALQSQAAEAEQPQTLGDLFPEGEGRVLVLNNCASCHAVACSVIGQRTPARWNAIQEAHADRLPGLSQESFETIFAYLQSNFDDTQPEPNVPAAFLQRGCTPN